MTKFRTKKLLGPLAAAMIIGIPSTALACRTLVPNNDRIAEHGDVVIGAISTSDRLNSPAGTHGGFAPAAWPL